MSAAYAIRNPAEAPAQGDIQAELDDILADCRSLRATIDSRMVRPAHTEHAASVVGAGALSAAIEAPSAEPPSVEETTDTPAADQPSSGREASTPADPVPAAADHPAQPKLPPLGFVWGDDGTLHRIGMTRVDGLGADEDDNVERPRMAGVATGEPFNVVDLVDPGTLASAMRRLGIAPETEQPAADALVEPDAEQEPLSIAEESQQILFPALKELIHGDGQTIRRQLDSEYFLEWLESGRYKSVSDMIRDRMGDDFVPAMRAFVLEKFISPPHLITASLMYAYKTGRFHNEDRDQVKAGVAEELADMLTYVLNQRRKVVPDISRAAARPAQAERTTHDASQPGFRIPAEPRRPQPAKRLEPQPRRQPAVAAAAQRIRSFFGDLFSGNDSQSDNPYRPYSSTPQRRSRRSAGTSFEDSLPGRLVKPGSDPEDWLQ